MSLLALIRLAFTRRKQRLNLLDGVFERAQATTSAAKMGYGNGLHSGVNAGAKMHRLAGAKIHQ
jgi:hypothetical protein